MVSALALLLTGTVSRLHAQPSFPPTDTNTYPADTNQWFNPPGTAAYVPVNLGTEFVLLDTLPTTPSTNGQLASWATIRSGGMVVDTNNEIIIDTNAVPSDDDGLPAGAVAGVVLAGLTNPVVITHGDFYVVLTNGNNELANTRFEVKIMRDTNDFRLVFNAELAGAEYLYDTNSTNVTLTPATGTGSTNMYRLSVLFPRCVVTNGRVISIRTEPADFELPYAPMQWLIGTGTSQTYTTTGAIDTVLTAQTNCPSMKLWARAMGQAGLTPQLSFTTNTLQLFTVPGMILTAAPTVTGPYADLVAPDAQGFGEADMSQTNTGFFGVRIDNLSADAQITQ